MLLSEKLPISIHVSTELKTQFSRLGSVSNKLEAQFNFQTLTAGWYGDEENIFLINLIIETADGFLLKKIHNHQGTITEFSDDVFSFYNEAENETNCFIAITDSEQKLLSSQEKVLPVFINKKLQKILNLIAAQHHLLAI